MNICKVGGKQCPTVLVLLFIVCTLRANTMASDTTTSIVTNSTPVSTETSGSTSNETSGSTSNVTTATPTANETFATPTGSLGTATLSDTASTRRKTPATTSPNKPSPAKPTEVAPVIVNTGIKKLWLDSSFKLNDTAKWDDTLADQTSPLFLEYRNEIENKLKEKFQSIVGFHDVIITNFTKGSIVTWFKVSVYLSKVLEEVSQRSSSETPSDDDLIIVLKTIGNQIETLPFNLILTLDKYGTVNLNNSYDKNRFNATQYAEQVLRVIRNICMEENGCPRGYTCDNGKSFSMCKGACVDYNIGLCASNNSVCYLNRTYQPECRCKSGHIYLDFFAVKCQPTSTFVAFLLGIASGVLVLVIFIMCLVCGIQLRKAKKYKQSPHENDLSVTSDDFRHLRLMRTVTEGHDYDNEGYKSNRRSPVTDDQFVGNLATVDTETSFKIRRPEVSSVPFGVYTENSSKRLSNVSSAGKRQSLKSERLSYEKEYDEVMDDYAKS